MANKREIKNLIETARCRRLGIDAPRPLIGDVEKRWSKPFEIMSEGLDCIEREWEEKKLQLVRDVIYSKQSSNN